jgi:predicted Zn-dependent peptidase
MRKLCRAGVFACVLLPAYAADVRLPKYTRQTLPNGAVVYIVPRPGLPLVNFRVVIRGGNESDPANLPGVAQIAAELLRKGTPTRTAAQFSDELDSLGGELRTLSNEQATVVMSEFLAKDFARGVELTADALLHATLPEAEVSKAIARAVDRAKTAKDNPRAVMPLYFRAFFFGAEHPYGRVADDRSFARIDRKSIEDYRRRMYVGKNMLILAAGEIDPATAAAPIAKAFGEAPAGVEYKWAPDAAVFKGKRLLLIDKPDATQTYFEIGQPGIRRSDPERTTMQVINTLFGGRFTSMLNDELRVNSGLTYGAVSVVDAFRMPGAIRISTYTRTETTEKAMDLALDVLKRFVERGITAEQLASAKAYVKGTYPRQFLETSEQTATVLGDIELFGLNRGEVDDLFSRIGAVTLEHANAAAKRRYGNDVTFVVMGNAAKIRDTVKKYAPEVREISVKDAGFGL